MEFYGISYTVFQDKQTQELKVRIWLDSPDIDYSHAQCVRELVASGHMPNASGIMLYDKTTNCWVPIFEETLIDNRPESLRRRYIDVASQEIERQLHNDMAIKERLSVLWEEHVQTEYRKCVAKNMPTEAIRIYIQNMRSNPYF